LNIGDTNWVSEKLQNNSKGVTWGKKTALNLRKPGKRRPPIKKKTKPNKGSFPRVTAWGPRIRERGR